MKEYVRKLISLTMIFVLSLCMAIPVLGSEIGVEWYELEIIENDTYFDDIENIPIARSKYISSTITRITEVSSGKVAMRVDAYCNSTVKKIEAVLTLQKKVNGSWTNVGSATVSVTDTYKLSKTATASGLSSGTYRTKSTVRVTDYSGYTETVTGYSGSIVI